MRKFYVLRVWCAQHQIGIAVNLTAEIINEGTSIKAVYWVSVYVQSQNNFIITMGVKCLKKSNQWVHLGRVLNLYQKHRRPIIAHIMEKNPQNVPAA